MLTQAFRQLYEDERMVGAACRAHARRKLHEIHIAHGSPITGQAIERIAALYAIKAEIRGSTPVIRKAVRLSLHHVLERIAEHPISAIDQLLSSNVTLTSHTASQE